MSSPLIFLSAIYIESLLILHVNYIPSNVGSETLFNWRNSVSKELSDLLVTTELSPPSFCLWAGSGRHWPLNELCPAERRPPCHTLQWLFSCSSHVSKFFSFPCPLISCLLPRSTMPIASITRKSVHGPQQIGLQTLFLNVRFPPGKPCMNRKDGWQQTRRRLRATEKPMRPLSAALYHPRSCSSSLFSPSIVLLSSSPWFISLLPLSLLPVDTCYLKDILFPQNL